MDTIEIKTGKDLLNSGIKHFEAINGVWIGKNDDYEQKYKRLLTGETIKENKYTIYELMFIMNGELNINTLSFQKSGRDTYYIKVDDPTKQYYINKFDME